MDAPPDARTAIWLEYSWAVATGNASTAALLAAHPEAAEPAPRPATAPDDDPLGDLDLTEELEELAEEAAGELPATAGWFGPDWQPGGAVCLEEPEDAASALTAETWAALADATTAWRHAGRSGAADESWRATTEAIYRQATDDGSWDPGWFRRFWDLADVDPDVTVLAVVGHGREGVLDAAALVGALRPNVVLTTSERIGDAVRDALDGLPVLVVDPEHGTTAEGRPLTFNEWALAASTLLR
jgi:hypothetical protein